MRKNAPVFSELTHWPLKQSCQVTLDISGSPIESQWAPGNIQGNLDRYAEGSTAISHHAARNSVSLAQTMACCLTALSHYLNQC